MSPKVNFPRRNCHGAIAPSHEYTRSCGIHICRNILFNSVVVPDKTCIIERGKSLTSVTFLYRDSARSCVLERGDR